MRRRYFEIEELLQSGASIEVSANDYPSLLLEEFAEIAAQFNGILSIKDTDRLHSLLLKEILAKGGRNVVFK